MSTLRKSFGYLKSARIEDGLLINFGSYKFQIKKYILNEQGTRNMLKNIIGLLSFALTSMFFFG